MTRCIQPRVLILAAAGLICILGEAIAGSPPAPTGPSLKVLGARHHLLIGGSSDLNHNDTNEEAIIKREYSILSDENCLKPDLTEPSRNSFDFSQPDKFVTFCKENGIVAKGHTLLGRNAYLPKWMLDPKLTAPQLREILINHIRNVMGRYKKGSPHGEIKYWDVLNEVIAYPSVFEKLGRNSDGDFLYWELAFQTAHDVDPSCILIWNEDNIEIDPSRAEKLYNTVKRLKAREVPIDAIGFQCHIGLARRPAPNNAYLARTFKSFADLGLDIVISEMDVPDSLDQVGIYKGILTVCANQPKCIIWDTWGVVDKYSWRNDKDHGLLLFDDNYQAKPTYYAVQLALENAGHPIVASPALSAAPQHRIVDDTRRKWLRRCLALFSTAIAIVASTIFFTFYSGQRIVTKTATKEEP